MPSKSRRQSKKSRARQRASTMPSPAIGTAPQPTIAAAAATPKTAASLAAPGAKYAHVAGELRTIGIIAGIILVVLIVLSRFLS